MILMSLEQIKKYEKYLIDYAGFNSLVLMENAATSIFNFIKNNFLNKIIKNEDCITQKYTITVLAGNSNNGGDAIAVSRKIFLFLKKNNFINFKINILILDKNFSEENLYQQKIIKTFIYKNDDNNNNDNNSTNYSSDNNYLELIKFSPDNIESLEKYFNCNLLIDGIFGIGLKGKLREQFANFFKKINFLKVKNNFKTIAIDLPSGLTEDYFNTTIFADYVLTLSYPKLSLFLPENRKNFDKLEILDIEFPAPEDLNFFDNIYKLDNIYQSNNIKDTNENNKNHKTNNNYKSEVNKNNNFFNLTLIDKQYIKSIYKPRNDLSNKGGFGRVCIVGGNFNTIGAAIVAARSSLSSGAGLVYLFSDNETIQNIKSSIPQIITLNVKIKNYKDKNKYDFILDNNVKKLLHKINTFIIGPGFGNNENLLYNYLKIIIETLNEKNSFNNLSNNLENTSLKKPSIIVDADALNLYSKSLKIKDLINNNVKKINFIFTPHMLEFSRLIDLPIENIKAKRIEIGSSFSKKMKIYLYLKDAITFSFSPDNQIACNYGLNSGFSKGGTGDFISGIIGSFIAQGYSPFESMNFASHLLDKLTIYFNKKNISKYSYTPQLLIDALKYVINFKL